MSVGASATAGLAFEVQVQTHSLTNQRCHWSVKARQAKDQRKAVYYAWSAQPRGARDQLLALLAAGYRLVVTLKRWGKRELDDDNLRGALKAVRDQVAVGLGVDDRDPRVAWGYSQGVRPVPCVVVHVEVLR